MTLWTIGVLTLFQNDILLFKVDLLEWTQIHLLICSCRSIASTMHVPRVVSEINFEVPFVLSCPLFSSSAPWFQNTWFVYCSHISSIVLILKFLNYGHSISHIDQFLGKSVIPWRSWNISAHILLSYFIYESCQDNFWVSLLFTYFSSVKFSLASFIDSGFFFPNAGSRTLWWSWILGLLEGCNSYTNNGQ